jgi:hypothetical protein
LPYAVQTFLPSLAGKAIARFVVNANLRNTAAREYKYSCKLHATRCTRIQNTAASYTLHAARECKYSCKLQAASYKLQAASKYRIQLKGEGRKPKANTAARYTLHAAREYRIQLKAESCKLMQPNE